MHHIDIWICSFHVHNNILARAKWKLKQFRWGREQVEISRGFPLEGHCFSFSLESTLRSPFHRAPSRAFSNFSNKCPPQWCKTFHKVLSSPDEFVVLRRESSSQQNSKIRMISPIYFWQSYVKTIAEICLQIYFLIFFFL